MSRQDSPAILPYVALLSLSALAVSGLLWRNGHLSARTLLFGALFAHAITLAGGAAFEDDYFRFMWDGARTLSVGTPYGVAPDQFFADVALSPALQAVLNGVNNPEYPTIYGPTLQLLFAGTYALFASNPLGLGLLFAGANLLIILLLLRRYTPGQVALYAWQPLVIVESSLHLHPDGLMAVALVAAWLTAQRYPAMAGLFFALAAGVKLVALAVWPLLLRLPPRALLVALAALAVLYLPFLVQGNGAGFESTATFATQWHFNPLAYEIFFQLFGWNDGRLWTLLIAGAAVLWMHARSRSLSDVPMAAIFGIILLLAPAVNSWYLLWLLPFAVGRRWLWPYAAAVALPLSYLTGLNLDDPTMESFAVHPWARWAEWSILALALMVDLWSARYRRADAANADRKAASPLVNPAIAVIMPALNEEASVGGVVTGISAAMAGRLQQIIVVDNGSSDATVAVAHAAGAHVVSEAERGYGAACLKGIATLTPDIDIILFMDSDGSDVATDAAKIIAPIMAGTADMVIGSRALGRLEPGAMSAPQRFGNWLAPLLVRLIWGVHYTDLGPFRAIRRDSLDLLDMRDRDFGWTIEMQVRAAKLGLSTCEVPTDYRKRIGISKISGTISGVVRAGTKILFVIGREAFGDFGGALRPAARQQDMPSAQPMKL